MYKVGGCRSLAGQNSFEFNVRRRAAPFKSLLKLNWSAVSSTTGGSTGGDPCSVSPYPGV
jgi:hypothetical protein